MGKITFLARTFLLVIFLLGSSINFLSANYQSIEEILISETIENVSCHNGNNGNISVNISGGVPPYSITWTGLSQTTETISGLSAGYYTIIVTDSEENSAKKILEITEPDFLQLSSSTTTDVSCDIGEDGSITAGTVTGGTVPYEYSINGSFSPNNYFPDLSAGSYTITVRDSKGCETTEQVTVSEPDGLTMASPTTTPVTCNGGNDGTITAGEVSGGNGSYQYKLNEDSYQNSNFFSGLTEGTYTITVKDSKDCEATEQVIVSEPEILTMASPASTPVSCNGGNDGTVTAGEVSGGNGSYQYKLNDGSFQNSNSFSGLTEGIYTITVKDSKDCEATEQVIVLEPEIVTMAAPSFNAITICAGSSVSTIEFSGGNFSNTSFNWTNNNTAIGLAANGSGNISSFTATNNTSSPISAEITVTPMANGCTGISHTISLTVNPSATVTKPENIISCRGSIIPAIIPQGSGVDGTHYLWTNSNTSIGLGSGGTGTIPQFTAENNTGSPITSEIVLTPVANGCPGSSQTFSITVNPTTTVRVQDDIFACNEEPLPSISFTGSNVSGTSYRWSNDTPEIGLGASGVGDIPAFTANNETSAPVIATITVTPEANGCTGSPISFTITVFPTINIVAPEMVLTTPGCYGASDGSITVGTVYGGNGKYLFSIDGKNYNEDRTFTGLAAGNHTIYIKDTQRCSFQEEITLGQPEDLSVIAAQVTPVSCFGASDGTITAGTVSGGNGEYQFSLDNTNFFTTKVFTGLPAGDYTIFIKDIKGCSLQEFVTVTEPAVLKATTAKTDVKCFGGNTGTISITNPSGGSNSYEYSINGQDWVSTATFTGLAMGSYKVMIRDKNSPSCTKILQEAYQINQPSSALNVEISTTRTTTYGTSTGTATAAPKGGTPGYFYEWRKTGETTILKTTQSASNLGAGNYELTVRDSNGCSLIHPFKIIDKVKASIIFTSLCLTQHDYLRTSTFQVDLPEVAGGVGSPANFIYNWNFGSDASITTGTGTGKFTVTWGNFGDKVVSLTITDEAGVKETYNYNHYVGACFEGCGETENFNLNINNIYIGDKDGNKLTGYNCEETTEKYLWIDILKNANGYSLNAELNYAVNDGVQTYARKAVGCFEEVIGTSGNKNVYKPVPLGLFRLFPVQETGTAADKITWKCGETLKVEQILIRWTNQENRGCGEGTKPMCYGPDYTINVNTPLMVTAIPENVLCRGTNNGSIIIHATGGHIPYQYRITGPKNVAYQAGNQFYDLPAGNYNYDVKDAKNNVTSGSVTVNEPSTILSATITSVDPLCYGETGQATVIPVGGTPFVDGEGNPYYQYVWNSGQTTSTATELLDGIYSVTVRDANGCEVLKTIEIFEPEQLTIAEAGEDIIYNCGFRVAELLANTPEKGIGKWTIISSENGGMVLDPTDPATTFTGNAGVHTLRWTIANEDGTCESYSEVNVTFSQECSTLDFDGIDDYVFFDDNYGLTSGSFTLEAWVKPNSLGGVKTVLSKRNSLNLSEGGYDLIINNGSPTFRWGGSGSVSTSHKINTDRWYHLAIIFKDSQVKLYVDGINLGTATATNPKAVTHPFLVGAMFKDNKQNKPQNLFNGWIEEVRVWNSPLNEEQLRFLMNQRVKLNSIPLRGTVLPVNVPGTLQWTNLLGYYRMIGETVVNGMTLDEAENKAHGELRNITTTQQNTAPLPYISANDSEWGIKTTWLRPVVWDFPNSKGINGAPITWNIARISNNIFSGQKNITMLGLLSENNKLTMANPNSPLDENNPGQGLTVTHYLRLDGVIDLVGESQLIQTDIDNTQTIISILDEASSGYIERAQQGTANSYNYNYWSSPVSLRGAANNSTYTIGQVMLDGSSTANYGKGLNFGARHEFADGGFATPRKISNYWLHKFRGTANVYSEWAHIGSTGALLAGEGYTMKGTSGDAAIEDRQNYVFRGKPNNGTITLEIGKDQNYLLGNPYPSAIDVSDFITDNLKDVAGGRNTQNIFNGALYFWDHFSGGNTHILKEYIGGYATRNLLDGVPAISNDERVNANEARGSKIPGPYIPVGQGFFINTAQVSDKPGEAEIHGGEVLFKNGQREFVRKSTGNTGSSVFLSKEINTKKTTKAAKTVETPESGRIRLDFISPLKYNRQILVGVDPNTTSDFDLGYDAPLNDYNAEDMYWLINNREYVIQGVPDFNLERVLPLGIVIDKVGEFTIKINDLKNVADDLNIFIKDNTEETYTNLRKGDFKINMDRGIFHTRFEIVFQQVNPVSEEEEIEKDLSQNPDEQIPGEEITTGGPEVFYLVTDMHLLVKNPEMEKINKITLHSLSGQVIEEYTGIAPSKEIKLPVRSYSSSVYVVKVFTDKGVIYKKMIINN